MQIGKINIGSKLFLSPMAEVSDAPFRKIAKANGAGITFTQMVSAKGIISNNFDSLKLLAFGRDEKPIGVQLLGNDPSVMYSAVKEILPLKPDLFDLNCGCPIEKVTRHHMGSSLLDDPELLGKIVNSMVKASEGTPVSVKIRLGRDWKKINALEIIKVIEDNGGSFVFVHARTRSDKYDVPAKWEWLTKIKENSGIPIVGNGSLFHPEDVLKMQFETGCNSAIIARGALGNPFIFSRYNKIIETGIDPGIPDPEIVKNTALRHIHLLKIEYGELVAINPVKKNVIWYFRFYNGITEFLQRVISANSLNQIIDMIEQHTENLIAGNYPECDCEEIERLFRIKALFWLHNKELSYINEI